MEHGTHSMEQKNTMMKNNKMKSKIKFQNQSRFFLLKSRRAIIAISSITILLFFLINTPFLNNFIRTAFAADLSAIVGSSGADIYLTPGNYTFTGNLTIPAGKTLHYERGAVITVGAGQTLSINGATSGDPLYKIFQDSSGDLSKGVKFANGITVEVRPEWWGGATTGSQAEADNISNAIEKAIHSHNNFKTTIVFSNGNYHISRPIVLVGSVSLQGQGGFGSGNWGVGTLIRPKNGIGKINLVEDSTSLSSDQSSEISYISFGGAYTTNNIFNFTHGISNWKIHDCGTLETADWSVNMVNVNNVKIERNFFAGNAVGVIHVSGRDVQINFNEIPTNQEFGVFLDGCQNCTLNGNIIFGDGGDVTNLGKAYLTKAIYAKDSPGAVVTGNRTDNWDIGILIDNSPGIYKYNSELGDLIQGIRIENNLSDLDVTKNYISVGSCISPYSIDNRIFGGDSSWQRFFVDPDAKSLVFKDNFLDLWNAAVVAGIIDAAKLNKLKLFWEKYAKEPNENCYGMFIDGNDTGSGKFTDNNFQSSLKGTILYKANSSSGDFSEIEDNFGIGEASDFPVLASASSPEVVVSNQWKTENVSHTEISDFMKASVGKEILIIFGDSNTVIKFSSGSALRGHGGTDWSPKKGDHMRCTKQKTYWFCECFDNTP
jgi:hypothetical protein